jgi:hypothetical protein
MSFRDDIEVAHLLLNTPLSSPDEKEARAAAARVLSAVADLIFKIDNDIKGEDFIRDDRVTSNVGDFGQGLRHRIKPLTSPCAIGISSPPTPATRRPQPTAITLP